MPSDAHACAACYIVAHQGGLSAFDTRQGLLLHACVHAQRFAL